MIRTISNVIALFLLSLVAAACSTTPPPPPPYPDQEANAVRVPPAAGIYKIGNPYEQNGVWYYPREQPDYDETGIASWYGPTFHGQHTANGEIFDSTSLSAAHRTLPMPSNVRVTNLDNGRSLVVRVNDRGPFAHGRIIDVSQRAAELLGFKNQGTARVRVTYASNAALPNGDMPAQETPPMIASAVPAAPTQKVDSEALNIVPGATIAPPVATATLPEPVAPPPIQTANQQPTGQVTTVPVPSITHLYVQGGAFSSLENANRLKERLSGAGGVIISAISRAQQKLYRVRLGPFDQLSAADAALARVLRLGNNDAKIVVDR